MGSAHDFITTLLAKQEITEQIYRYCRSMDRVDLSLGYSVWHDDSVADYSPLFLGLGRKFIDWACNHHLAHAKSHSHQVANILIEVQGDHAESESYFSVVMITQDSAHLTVAGRYLDKWTKREGRWALTHRRCIGDIVNSSPAGDSAMMSTDGRRDTSDISYELAIAWHR